MVEGWFVSIEPCYSLTQEQLDHIRWTLSILAVSTRGLFDDPVIFTGQSMQAHYTTEYRAQETCDHIRAYLQTIHQDQHVKVTLSPATWDRSRINQLL